MLFNQLKLLISDLEFYCGSYPDKKMRLVYLSWCIKNLLRGILISRDFRLNVLVRLRHSKLPVISKACDSLIFYLYHSLMSPGSQLNCKLRFCHATNVIIGSRVVMSGEFAYIFNNVTIGKLIPGARPTYSDMPCFLGSVVFGVGSSVLGPLVANADTVFSANSLCTVKLLDKECTISGVNNIKSGAYFNRLGESGEKFSFINGF